MQGLQMASFKARPQLWLRIGSLLISLAALAFLASSFNSRLFSFFPASVLLALLLAALAAALGLHVRFLILLRKEHRETAKALDATELEYKAVFDNILDGIVVFDNCGICLAANSAAALLFGSACQDIIGKRTAGLFAGATDFAGVWKEFVDGTNAHNEIRILRPDGSAIFVEYTVKTNYLLGRHVAVLRDVTERKRAEAALRESEERFQQMASNIQEIFWMFDAETKEVIYVNKAYEDITGRSCEPLEPDAKSYEEILHPEDRNRVVSRLSRSLECGGFDEEFRIVMPDGALRWVWARGFPVRNAAGAVRRLVGSAQDITARKSAEQQTARNLDLAERARAEAEAFRKTSLALTQNLRMDYVLDTLLESLFKLIPCDSAQILLVEAGTRLFLAREVRNYKPDHPSADMPLTFDARNSGALMSALVERKSVLIADTLEEPHWEKFRGFAHLRSWLCAPLVASENVLGLLSLGARQPQAFSQEHRRLAKSLAIPAAVAIQNARLYEQAEILRTELEQRLADIEQTEQNRSKHIV